MAEFDSPTADGELGERIELCNVSFPVSPPADWLSDLGSENS
jgi:hypothetical protein